MYFYFNIIYFNFYQYKLLDEIQTYQKLNHPGFIKLIETYSGENSYYLITELCEGNNLYQYIH